MRDIEKIYSTIISRGDDVADSLDAEQKEKVARNGFLQILANTLQSSGDQVVKASTVLPWLFHALGVPGAFTGLLVPIRESGSMLPQAFLTPLVLRFRRRKWLFVIGALIQALAAGIMAITAATGSGMRAGIIILSALGLFSLGRALGSITSKDVQGRTIPKGERGQINGIATTTSGLVVITLGFAIRYFGGTDLSGPQIAWLLASGSALWLAVALVYARINEPAGETPNPTFDSPNWLRQMWDLLREDHTFRKFVTARSLLLVSALSPPFIITLAAQSGHDALSGLGGYIIASGLAALVGGRIFGRLADRSSKHVMAIGAGAAAALITALVVIINLPNFGNASLLAGATYILAYFGLTLIHTGVRVGRKTYVVDMAQGDQRTTYVAVSNSAMGLILLLVGALSSAMASFDISWALLFLACLGAAGSLASFRLPKISNS